MGCCSSNSASSKLKKQKEKLQTIEAQNQAIEGQMEQLNSPTPVDPKVANGSPELTNLKSTIDSRFNKLEKVIERMHSDFKFTNRDGIVDNLGDRNENMKDPNKSLSLDFKEEKAKHNINVDEFVWKDLLNETSMSLRRMSIHQENLQSNDEIFDENANKGTANLEQMRYFCSNENIIVNHNDIKMSMNTLRNFPPESAMRINSTYNSKRLETKEISKTLNANDILDDEQARRMYSEVRSAMIKPQKVAIST